MLRSTVFCLLLAGCAAGTDPEPAAAEAASPRLRSVGLGTIPYQKPELWPLSVESPRIIVHYRAPEERAMAGEVLGDLEDAWTVQIDQGGALPPLDDHAVAGPDGRFDVYLWRGIDTLYVDGVAEEPATPYDDWSTYMVLDPWGKYGGAELRANIFHELRHASQGSDDWWEHIEFFEAEATMWEVAEFGFERLALVWADYQAHPDWTPFRDDNYRTWFMYGGALFLLYVRDHVYGGDLAFSNELWHRCRNPPGAATDPTKNEPDFADALQSMLVERQTSLFEELLGFARARWYTGARANGSLPGGPVLPEVAHALHTRKAGAGRTSFSVAPQLLGTSYVLVERASSDPATLWVSLATNSKTTRFVVQAVGGGAPDARLAAGAAAVPVSFGAAPKLAFVVTALPADGVFDPDAVPTKTLNATLTLATAP